MKTYKTIIIGQKSTMQKIKGLLEYEGFNISSSHPFDESFTAPAGREFARFDIFLPEECMASIFQKIHAGSCRPYFMMTARIDNADQLVRMEKGVRDTIDMLMGTAAVEAPSKKDLNHGRSSPDNETLVAGPISIDFNSKNVSVLNAEIHLTPIEFKILRFLASNPEKLVTRRELVTALYGSPVEDRFRVVDCHISRIRKKISRHLPARNVIRSIYGTGYTFVAPEETRIEG